MAKTATGTGGGAQKTNARKITFTQYTGNIVKGGKALSGGTAVLTKKAAQNNSKKSGGGSGGGAARKMRAKQPM